MNLNLILLICLIGGIGCLSIPLSDGAAPNPFLAYQHEPNDELKHVADLTDKVIVKRQERIFREYSIQRYPTWTVRQETNYYCGPAVAQAVLQAFGVRSVFTDRPTNRIFQDELARQMATTHGGTYVERFVPVLNELLTRSPRRIEYVTTSYPMGVPVDTDLFYDLVYDSLSNDIPVPMTFFGSIGTKKKFYLPLVWLLILINNI